MIDFNPSLKNEANGTAFARPCDGRSPVGGSPGQATCQRRTLATHRTALPQPKPRRFRFPGKPLDYRKVLTGIIFVLKTASPGGCQEMGCGCGMTCLNYLNAWQRAGVWEKLHQILLAELEQADKLDWSRAGRSAKARALGGGDQTGPSEDRGKPGTKHHVLTEGQGVPLVTHNTGANVPDVNELLPLVDDIPPVRGKADRPRGVPDNLYADRTYDSQPHRQELEWRGMTPTWRGVGRTRQRPGGLSLGGGADLVVAAQLSQAPVADRSRGSGP